MTRTEEFAVAFESAVRDAFTDVYGPPPHENALMAIRTSWSDHEMKLGWQNPDPRFVVVGTEHGWVSDPWLSPEDHALWEKMTAKLTADGWGDVHFDSINAAVHVVFIDLPDRWHAILIERAHGRSER